MPKRSGASRADLFLLKLVGRGTHRVETHHDDRRGDATPKPDVSTAGSIKSFCLAALGMVGLSACAVPPYARAGFAFEPIPYYPAAPEGKSPSERVRELVRDRQLTLDQVLAVVDLLNPDLNAARKEVDIRGAQAWDAGLYPNPKVTFEVEEFPTSNGGFGNATRLAGIEQNLPISGRLSALRRVREMEREVQIERYRELRRKILLRAKVAFFEYLSAKQRLELLKRNAAIARTFHEIAREKFQNRAAPEIEVLKAAIQRSILQVEERSVKRDVETARRALKALMGNIDLPFEDFEGKLHEEYEAVSEDALRGQILSGHPALEAARKEIIAAELQIELAQKERWPDVGFSVQAGKGENDDNIIQAGIEVPVPLFNNNRARILEARLRAEQARMLESSERQRLLLSLRRAYGNYVSAQERVKSYRDEILPKATKALKQAEQGFRAGEFAFLRVLDAQRTLVETQLTYQAALMDLERAAAALEELTGKRLRPLR